MLIDIQGDLFESSAPAIGHGVNLDGLMGGGVAALVRERFPNVNAEYEAACRATKLFPGEIQPVLTSREDGSPLYVLNMVTQNRPGPNAKLGWIYASLCEALHFCVQKHYSMLAIPRLGSGIGGLDWETQVRPEMLKATNFYSDIDLEVWYL